MYYERGKLPHGLAFDPFSSCVVPRPIGWISTLDAEGNNNLAPYSQFQNVTFNLPLLPGVPTTAEAGMPRLAFSAWLGVLAPAGTPVPVLEQLSARLIESIKSPEAHQKFIDVGFSVPGASRGDTDRMLKTERARWAAVVKSADFRGD